jgi:hypothetical protein
VPSSRESPVRRRDSFEAHGRQGIRRLVLLKIAINHFLEYEELIEEGKQLRLEWKRLAAEVASTKPQQEPQDFANYDIRKCLSSGKPKKQANQDNQKESGIKIEDLGAIEFGNVESGKAEFDNAGQEDIDQTDTPIDSDDENSELCVV